jgi:ubiquinone biosynthesis protein COQ9
VTGEGLDLRIRVHDAALPHVPFDGWSRAALHAGAVAAGLAASDADRAFPGGGRSFLAFHLDLADRRMLEALAGHDLAGMKVRERIGLAIRVRLEQAAGHKEAVRRGVSAMAMPGGGGLGARSLYRTVDAIWRACGDTATDFNFYTKRALLAGVYGSTLLYWLADGSEGHADTWAFLDRRIADVMAVPKATARMRAAGQGIGRGLAAPLRICRALSRRGTAAAG